MILIRSEDLAETGFADRELVDVVSVFQGEECRAERFHLVAYPTARGCVAAYHPEADREAAEAPEARESVAP